MALSKYHQKYVDQSDAEIRKKAEIKEQELRTIFETHRPKIEDRLAKIAVLGCGDKRFIKYHKDIFESLLRSL